MIMSLIRYSNGGFSHSDVMNLTFSQFYTYHDALEYCLNSETKEGKKKNDKKDRLEAINNLEKDEIEEIKRKVKEHKDRISKFQVDGRQKDR